MDFILTKVQPLRGRLVLFLELCNLDMRQRTAGTALGLIWLYLNPLVSIAVIWFVFHFGLKTTTSSADSTNILLVSLMAWYFIQDTVITGMGAVTEKPYLVKKIKFPIEFLPLIKVVNSFRIHLPFLFLIGIVSWSSGNFSWLNILYFIFFMPVLLLFLSSLVFLLSTAIVFYRDLQSMVAMLMQLVFWATPIIWTVPENPKIISDIEVFNPIFFIVKIYRSSFLGQPMDSWVHVVIFTTFLLALCYCAFKLFGKLKDQFADVL
jgi:teichoic acid transport system permease protein